MSLCFRVTKELEAELPHRDQVSAYLLIYVGDRAFVFVFYPALLSSCKYFPVTNDQIERISQDNVFSLLSQKIVVIR